MTQDSPNLDTPPSYGKRLVAGLALAASVVLAANAWVAYRILASVALFGLVSVGWVLFRAPNLEMAIPMFGAMFDPRGWSNLLSVKTHLAVVAVLYALHWAEYRVRRDEHASGRWWLGRVPVPVQGLAYAAVALLYLANYENASDFICFKF